MVTGRERIKRALTFQECDVVPIEIRDVTSPPFQAPDWIVSGTLNAKGIHVDHWGCEWIALEDGVCGEVKGHPLADWSKLDEYRVPENFLKNLDLSEVNDFCAKTDKFVVPQWEPCMPNIFERMQHLRGTENLYMDLAYGDRRIFDLIERLNSYYIPLLEKWAQTDIDSIQIADDWGSQNSLLISPAMWREYFKPVYKQYCDIAKKNNKFVLMHSDGFIEDILDDLIEIGVNAINSQLFCMDIEKLAQKYHHRLAFWGEIDRQYIQVFGKPEDMKNAVNRISDAFFKYGHTGFVAQCVYTMHAPQYNKEAEWSAWQEVSRSWQGL
jgi:uroporphyrinogen decarboxylase